MSLSGKISTTPLPFIFLYRKLQTTRVKYAMLCAILYHCTVTLDTQDILIVILSIKLYGAKYPRMDLVKFVEDSLSKICSDMVGLSRPQIF